MWHGAYLAWLEEARVEALAAAGLAYSALSARGLELPVVSLSIDYRRPLRHGDEVAVWSQAEPPRGPRLPWRSLFETRAGGVAAEARVELVALELREGRQRVMRRLPADLQRAVQVLTQGPDPL